VIKFLKVVPLPLLLLSLIKGRVVRGFLEKTSAPASVPDAYQRLSEQFGESHALYNSILEKHDNWIDPQRLCQELSQRKIPLLVVYGSQDRVSGAEEALTLLQESGSNPTFAPIPEGGHALLWTHTGQLAAMISNFCTQFA
jgi:pimeloyl-ACP methyl ester carboxylesterase